MSRFRANELLCTKYTKSSNTPAQYNNKTLHATNNVAYPYSMEANKLIRCKGFLKQHNKNET